MSFSFKSLLGGAWRGFTDAGLNTGRLPARAVAPLSHLQSLALLGARLFVAQVFWLSGLTKIRDWDTTLALFENEYHVPLLPPAIAPYLGTAGELGLPVLLVLGLGGRFAALGLMVVNVMAALSLEDIAPAALMGHELWGVLLAVIALWGAGRWSVDHLLLSRGGGR
jgi:putative oxidoreductase